MLPDGAACARIPGLQLVPGVITREDETLLLEFIASLEGAWGVIRMRGQVAKRRMICYGRNYVTLSRKLTPAPPIPPPLLGVRERCAQHAGVALSAVEQVIIADYPVGAGIGWHADAPVFGEPVFTISLLGPAVMQFRRGNSGRATHAVTLPPRSLLVMRAASRWEWQHQVPPVRRHRYSITLRTLRRLGRSPA
jgi:alkylated DNA repair protein (DNA oxidative demethylase)